MAGRSSVPVSSSSGGENMYSLKWNHYHSYLTSGLAQLLDDDFSMTDVTLACEGQFIKVHKVALAVCSPFFKEYFKTYRMEKPGGLIVLANVKFKDLKNLIKFIYHGEVNISNAELNSFLRTANDLKIEGLVDAAGTRNATNSLSSATNEQIESNTSVTEPAATPTPRLPAFSHSSASGSGGPPNKRSRLSTSSGQITSAPTTNVQTSNIPTASSTISKSSQPSIPIVNTKQSTTPSVPLSHVEDYDPLDMEDENEEEMISLDEVKPEPISVYTVNDDNDEDSLDHHGDESSVYHDYDSPLNQPSGPGPSSANIQSHRMQPGPASRTVNKPPPAKNPISHWRTPRVLDGKYFKIISMDHQAKGIGVRATCVTCQRTIQGRIHPTSNFTTHMKHGHKDMFESYIRYKQSSSRQGKVM